MVLRIQLLLAALLIQRLPKVSFLVEEAHADNRHPQIAGRLQVVAGEDPRPPA